jgi:hypothetical protein
MSKVETRVTSLVVVLSGEPIFSPTATLIEIKDEAGGEFVVVCQAGNPGYGKISINPEEWPAMRAAINRMVRGCR